MGALSAILGFASLFVGLASPPIAWIAAIAGLVLGIKAYRNNMQKMAGKKVKDIQEMEIPSAGRGMGLMLAGTGIGLSAVSIILGLFTIFTIFMFANA